MIKKRKQYSPEFKAEVALAALKNEQSTKLTWKLTWADLGSDQANRLIYLPNQLNIGHFLVLNLHFWG